MFSREKSAPAKAGKAGPPGLSFIGPEVIVSGNIATSAQLHIDGRVEGDVTCDTLCQGESGAVLGNIQAGQARIAGLVDGTVTGQTVVLESTARITGDISYETLSIAAGARVEGRLARKEGAPARENAPVLIATTVKAGGAAPEPQPEELFVRPSGPKVAAG